MCQSEDIFFVDALSFLSAVLDWGDSLFDCPYSLQICIRVMLIFHDIIMIQILKIGTHGTSFTRTVISVNSILGVRIISGVFVIIVVISRTLDVVVFVIDESALFLAHSAILFELSSKFTLDLCLFSVDGSDRLRSFATVAANFRLWSLSQRSRHSHIDFVIRIFIITLFRLVLLVGQSNSFTIGAWSRGRRCWASFRVRGAIATARATRLR